MGLFDERNSPAVTKVKATDYTIETSDYVSNTTDIDLTDNDINIALLTIESLSNIAMSIQDTFENEIEAPALVGYELGFESATAAIGLKGGNLFTSNVDYTVEAIGETISKIWAKIVEVIKALFKSISQFFKGLFNQEKKLQFKLENMKAELKKNRKQYADSSDEEIVNKMAVRYNVTATRAIEDEIGGLLADLDGFPNRLKKYKAITKDGTLDEAIKLAKDEVAKVMLDTAVSSNVEGNISTYEFYDDKDYMGLTITVGGDIESDERPIKWTMQSSFGKNTDYDESSEDEELTPWTLLEVETVINKLLEVHKSESLSKLDKSFSKASKEFNAAIDVVAKVDIKEANILYQRLLGGALRSELKVLATSRPGYDFKRMVAAASLAAQSMKELKKAKANDD